MRFKENGPSIPDELLNARDEGRTVFFCGAGVSRAKAGLTDFFGLAERVALTLGVQSSSNTARLLDSIKKIAEVTGEAGLVSADRVFGALERDFRTADIESAVAKALRTGPKVDLSAHRTLLDLATTPEGRVQLVTTNFDRLFSDCDGSLPVLVPPNMPHSGEAFEVNGIFQIHGRVNQSYDGSDGGEFVLSSSAFGRAYLSNGWATRFIQGLLSRYVVVFVGYSADDPPVQYLLEALNAEGGERIRPLYAFQAGSSVEAAGRWNFKGVEAIPYPPTPDHRYLWESLDAWAARARDPARWKEGVLTTGSKRPADFLPHERGQLAHLLTSAEGAAMFAKAESPPLAEWLGVWDPSVRLGGIERVRDRSGSVDAIDTFERFGLDRDDRPPKEEPPLADDGDRQARMKVAWDAFTYTREDLASLNASLPVLRGLNAMTSARMPPRLAAIAVWIQRVAHEPACVWWAARQGGLHSQIREGIAQRLRNVQDTSFPPPVRQAWHYLLDSWKDAHDVDFGWFKLRESLAAEGWTAWGLREYERLCQPRFKASSRSSQVVPLGNEEDFSTFDLLEVDVQYLEHLLDIPVPDDQLAVVVRLLGNSVERAVELEGELSEFGLNLYRPLLAHHDEQPSSIQGLEALVLSLCNFLDRLSTVSNDLARLEWTRISRSNNPIAIRLKIWGIAMHSLVATDEVAGLLKSLDDEVFWDSSHQGDLLLAIQARFSSMQEQDRAALGQRLLTLPRSNGTAADDAQKLLASIALSRVQWLENHGCSLPGELKVERERLLGLVPEWDREWATDAANGLVVRGGWVRSDLGHDGLEGVSIDKVLERAKAIAAQRSDFLVEKDPWGGYATAHRINALRVLAAHGKRGDIPTWAWSAFLQSERSNADGPRMTTQVARRLASYSCANFEQVLRVASDWLRDKADDLFAKDARAFYGLFDRILLTLQRNPELTRSGIVQNKAGHDWALEALNSPVGKLMQAAMRDPARTQGGRSAGFSAAWLERVGILLGLSGEAGLHGLVIVAFNLGYFFWHAAEWTKQHVIAKLESEDVSSRDAVWAGILWSGKTPSEDLYPLMKPHLLQAAVDGTGNKRRSIEALAGMILAGWGTPRKDTAEPYVSDEELRNLLIAASDDFRSQVLWIVRRWAGTAEELDGSSWKKNLSRLLRDVWPRQLSAKTFVLSERLVDLAFEFPADFDELAALVLPLVGTIEKDYLALHEVTQNGPDLAAKHPEMVLALLWTILPVDGQRWPYGLDNTLNALSQDAKIATDSRFIELRRRWNSR
jgi:hypothetical protein